MTEQTNPDLSEATRKALADALRKEIDAHRVTWSAHGGGGGSLVRSGMRRALDIVETTPVPAASKPHPLPLPPELFAVTVEHEGRTVIAEGAAYPSRETAEEVAGCLKWAHPEAEVVRLTFGKPAQEDTEHGLPVVDQAAVTAALDTDLAGDDGTPIGCGGGIGPVLDNARGINTEDGAR